MLELIKNVIADFHNRALPEPNVERGLTVPMDSGKIITIIGPRRTGKTYFLYSLIAKLRKNIDPRMVVYINFEDERLNMDVSHLQLILDAYEQLYPDMKMSDVFFFFDEVQVIEGWEKFARRIHESVSKNIFLTGSSAKLMGREIASSLRGRALAYVMLPFSFAEYLKYQRISISDIHSSKGRNVIITSFNRYLRRGGYPEVIDFDDELYIKTLQSYVDIMLYRDVIERHGINNVHVVKDMLKRLIATNGMIFSVNKYFNDLHSRGIKAGKDRLYEILGHLEDAYMILPLLKYATSVVKQEQSLKKVYVNDPGLFSAYNFNTGANLGQLLESVVYLELLKKNRSLCYWSDVHEADFLVMKEEKAAMAIQVCYDLTDENRKREVRGLTGAMNAFALETGLLLTLAQEEAITAEGKKIRVMPVWKWLLTEM